MRVLRLAGRLWTALLLVQALLFAALIGARLVLLPLVSDQPRLIAADPPDGASGVSPRSVLALQFSGPMNPPSVERALRLEPPFEAQLRWDAQRTTLTISPTTDLAPDTAYSLTVEPSALGRFFRPLSEAATTRFRTAPAPAVVAVFPADGAAEVPLSAPLSIRFSRPIVEPSALGRPSDLPELSFEPPLAGRVTWLDQRTALFRPSEPLQPGTRYRATLAPSLADLAGSRLGRPYSWSFSTPAPQVVSVSPAPGGQLRGPRAPLTLTLSQPLDLDAVRAGLSISPAAPGDVDSVLLPDGSQVITFTPAADWQTDVVYRAELAGVRSSSAGARELPLEPFSWSFSAPPRPALIGRFPGEGQALPAGREVRLVFSTPMEASALQQSVIFSPPVDGLSVVVSGAEVRIRADLQAATLYTVTLPADLADRSGVPLGRDYQLRFYTSPAAPTLALPELENHLIYAEPGAAAQIAVRRTNLSAITFDLYRLDADTVVRALAFREADWAAFAPERYGHARIRSWTVPLADPLNAVTESQIPVAESEDGGLSPGAYYLRLRAPEGLRADALVLASRTRLALQAAGDSALIWATDVISGVARPNLPLALYQSGSLVQQGATDADGLWLAALRGPGPFVVYALDEQPAVVSGSPALDLTTSASWIDLALDRSSYRPGERIELAGFVQRPPGVASSAPGAIVTVRPVGSSLTAATATLTWGDDGVLRGAVELDRNVQPGEYIVTAMLSGARHTRRITVLPAEPPPLDVAVLPPGAAGPAVVVRTPEGLPLAGATVSWTLSVERAPLPALDDFRFGDDERPPPPAAQVVERGVGETGADGLLWIELDEPAQQGGAGLRYRLGARVAVPGGLVAAAESTFAPPEIYTGIRLESQILRAGRSESVELVAVDGEGRPLPATGVSLEVYRRTWEPATGGAAGYAPRDELVLARQLTTDAEGRARYDLVLPPGEYRVRAASGEGAPAAAVSLWVTQPGFDDWGPVQAGRALLVSDRSAYRPGDTATLLLTAPLAQPDALVTLGRGGTITGTLRAIRPGEPFTVTIGLDDAPGVRVAVLSAAPQAPGAAELRAETTLPVVGAVRPLSVTVTADAARYPPGTSATLRVRAVDDAGAPVAASVVLSVAPEAVAPARQGDPLAGQSRSPAAPGATWHYWNSRLRTGATGTLTVDVPLPDEPAYLRARLWVVGEDAAGVGTAELRVGPQLALEVDAPAFLRAGDRFELAALAANTAAVTQTLAVSLDASGATLVTPAAQEVTLGPGQSERLTWQVTGGAGSSAALTVRAETPDGDALERRVGLPVRPAGPVAVAAGGALGEAYRAELRVPAAQRGGWGALDIEVAPSRSALVASAASAVAAQAGRGVIDQAGLLMLSSMLSDTTQAALPALERLAGLRNADGGWGWWPGGPSEPFPTAAALEALAAARDSGLPVPETLTGPGLDTLQALARDGEARPDLRAYALYVLSRYRITEPAALATLGANPETLGPDGLSFLLLARTPGEARAERATVARLTALARRDLAGVYWAAPADGTLPRTDAALTALAARALEHARLDEPLIDEARRWLAAARPVGTWQGGYEAARAVAALAPALPERPPAYTVELDGAAILDGSDGEQLRVTLPLERVTEQSTLAMSSAAPVLVSYRLRTSAAPGSPAGDVALLREFLDPQSGELLDPARLVAGQLVRVRLTLVASGAWPFLRVEEPLPGAMALQSAGAGDFEHVAHAGDRLILTSSLLTPGIYEHSYLLRALAPGRFAAPGPVARDIGGAARGRGDDSLLVVAPR